MDLYPDNKAQYLSFAGATNVTKYMRLMGSVSPGWLRQNDAFLPYTTNSECYLRRRNSGLHFTFLAACS